MSAFTQRLTAYLEADGFELCDDHGAEACTRALDGGGRLVVEIDDEEGDAVTLTRIDAHGVLDWTASFQHVPAAIVIATIQQAVL